MECEKEELERDIKNNWMDVLQRERMSESKENGHRGGRRFKNDRWIKWKI